MDYKRISIEFENEYSDATHCIYAYEGEYSENADKEIKDHLNDGWKIVSTSPVIESRRINAKGISGMGRGHDLLKHEWQDYVFTFTRGIEVFLVKD